jgi:hypothetical protein
LLPGLPTDQRVAATAAVLAVGGLVHAIANNAAEGALLLHRWTLRAAAAVLAAVAVYAAVRLRA